MGHPAAKFNLSPEAFLSGEADQPERHELVDGEAFAMAGADDLDSRCSDVNRKGADGLRVLHPFGAGEGLSLASMAVQVSADALWAEVDEVSAG